MLPARINEYLKERMGDRYSVHLSSEVDLIENGYVLTDGR
jgi:hypothetical protein